LRNLDLSRDTTASSRVTIVFGPLSSENGSCIGVRIFPLRIDTNQLTLEELLGRVFLEQCLMSDRSLEVIDEKVEDRQNLIFGIAGELGQSSIL
jgi:hypothetical protein